MKFCRPDDVPAGYAPVWDRRYPGRYKWELDVLEKIAGDSLTVDRDALERGTLIVRFDWPVNGEDTPLEAVYPDSFPRLRPAVLLRTPQETFPHRHCSPLDGTLCLLGRETSQWVPDITLRALLDEKLEDALNGTGTEDPQGEPPEVWWNLCGLPDSYCLVDSRWSVGQSRHGRLKLRARIVWKDTTRPVIRAAVTEILDEDGAPLATAGNPLPPELAGRLGKTLTIPWFRVDGALMPTGKPAQIQDLAARVPSRLSDVAVTSTKSLSSFAVLYDAEVSLDRQGLGFLFPVIFGTRKQMKGRHRRTSPGVGIIRTMRSGPEDLGARVRAVQSLRDKKVAVFGLGALGAPLALELARNGCGVLHLIDHDLVEPGNSIRWPLGTSAWGERKTATLAAFIEREYPWTAVEPHNHFIGLFSDAEHVHGDSKLFSTVLEDVDLVVDAAASHGVTGILGDHSRERGIPLVTLFASPNLEGGLVARFGPEDGCPTCLEYAWAAGDIAKPRGLGVDEGLQQPPGCAERTFTGPSYDLQELTLQAVRLVVQTLNSQDAALESSIYTLGLAGDAGPVPPQWEKNLLARRPECTCATGP